MIDVSTIAACGFWLCAGLVVYAYAGYPLLLFLCARMFGRNAVAPDEASPERLPFVSVLIAAHNEQDVIADRVTNLLDSDYPADRFEIVVASDGSDDRTASIVGRFTDVRVRLLDYSRRGKAAVLNAAVRELRGEIIVLSDANTSNDRHALRRLVRWFADPSVGVVCGQLVLTDSATGRNVDGLYWKYETFLKRHESRLGALLGANGAIYAIRRPCFTGIRANTAVDDFVIPLLARMRRGCRLVYDHEALAYEETPPELSDEFRRRTRIGAGGYQSLAVLHPLLDPRHGWIAVSFWSHKLLRWTCPFFMLGALVSSAALALEGTVYAVAFAVQLAGCGATAVGPYLPRSRSLGIRVARLTAMFTSMNLALLVGFWMWAAGRQGGVWQRTAR
jgi:cellulose synthase/poly-beta-1,6-N-acetylglucosamine synthase-like glycosyltransferase